MIRDKTLAQSLAESQNWRCCYCGAVMCGPSHMRDGGPRVNSLERKLYRATVEHVIPRSRGGTDAKENLIAACRDCNSKRGADDAFKFWWHKQNGNGHAKP